MRTAGVFVACAASMGCVVGTDATGPELDAEVDAASLALVGSYQGLARINQRPYKSDLGAFSINCYAAGDVADYRRIHPELTGTGATVAAGTVIVREVLDAAGQVTKLTVMAKGPPGYDPTLGDWWFAVTDPRGAPLVENGAPLVGRLAQCHACHIDRPRDDFLFGVPGASL